MSALRFWTPADARKRAVLLLLGYPRTALRLALQKRCTRSHPGAITNRIRTDCAAHPTTSNQPDLESLY